MQTYYHNTTASNPENMILGYVSYYGDFLEKHEYARYLKDKKQEIELPEDEPKIKIIAEGGLLSAGETIEEYCRRVAGIAFEAMDNSNIETQGA